MSDTSTEPARCATTCILRESSCGTAILVGSAPDDRDDLVWSAAATHDVGRPFGLGDDRR